MARSNYQYGTSPRKLQPEYRPSRRKINEEEEKRKKEEQIKKAKQKRIELKEQKRRYHINIMIIVGVFIVLFAISYRNSLITEKFNYIQEQKSMLALLEKSNAQLEVSIEESVSLSNVEKEAKERLGMQKLDNSQKVYVNLDKKDYTESVKEEITVDENSNWFMDFFSEIFK